MDVLAWIVKIFFPHTSEAIYAFSIMSSLGVIFLVWLVAALTGRRVHLKQNWQIHAGARGVQIPIFLTALAVPFDHDLLRPLLEVWHIVAAAIGVALFEAIRALFALLKEQD